MIRWLRVVLPIPNLFLCGVLGYALTVGWVLLTEAGQGVALPQGERRLGPLSMLCLVALLYALSRGLCFHPVLVPNYCSWLVTTPWNRRKPLPWPVHLVVQDVLLVGILCVVGWPMLGRFVLWVPQLFMLVYLVALAGAHFRTREDWCGYVVVFALGLMVRFWFEPFIYQPAAALTYAVAYLGLRRSLRRFPWESRRQASAEFLQEIASQKELLGWPFHRLGPRLKYQLQIPLHHGVLISLLCGWWFFVLTWLFDGAHANEGVMGLVFLFGLIAFGVRLGMYVDGYAPPLTFGGRLWTGHWVIPGYDQVLVAPLLGVALGAMTGYTCWVLGVDYIYTASATLTVGLTMVLCIGPSHKEWRLTGNHRIVPGSQQGAITKLG
jgi:hypothetical protein